MNAGARTPLEVALGRPLPLAEQDSVPDLNDVPQRLVAEARALGSRSIARELIEFYAGLANRPYLPAFLDEVVDGTMPPSRWRRGDVLVPDPTLMQQLCLTREELLAPIGGWAGVRTVPDLERWRSGDSSIGAPAHPRPDATYRTGAAAGCIRMLAPALEAAPDIEITLRRWIAARIARCLDAGQPVSVAGLRARLAVPDPWQWTADARIAMSALARERVELPPSDTDVPGFRGPDAWYLADDSGV